LIFWFKSLKTNYKTKLSHQLLLIISFLNIFSILNKYFSKLYLNIYRWYRPPSIAFFIPDLSNNLPLSISSYTAECLTILEAFRTIYTFLLQYISYCIRLLIHPAWPFIRYLYVPFFLYFHDDQINTSLG
jgi:hypothetical protein